MKLTIPECNADDKYELPSQRVEILECPYWMSVGLQNWYKLNAQIEDCGKHQESFVVPLDEIYRHGRQGRKE